MVCFSVTIDSFFDHANKHEDQIGTSIFEVDFNLGRITGGKRTFFLFGSSIVCSFVNYYIRYMQILIFHFHIHHLLLGISHIYIFTRYNVGYTEMINKIKLVS